MKTILILAILAVMSDMTMAQTPDPQDPSQIIKQIEAPSETPIPDWTSYSSYPLTKSESDAISALSQPMAAPSGTVAQVVQDSVQEVNGYHQAYASIEQERLLRLIADRIMYVFYALCIIIGLQLNSVIVRTWKPIFH